ncbi:hypothetical protein Syun_010755 [Stephania yunnanensis]|uniref:Uncharacterized protein n=1 Tax=Stephania yunnanensis TaxID=152371 RepID=A0AAP0KH21_9MAGN
MGNAMQCNPSNQLHHFGAVNQLHRLHDDVTPRRRRRRRRRTVSAARRRAVRADPPSPGRVPPQSTGRTAASRRVSAPEQVAGGVHGLDRVPRRVRGGAEPLLERRLRLEAVAVPASAARSLRLPLLPPRPLVDCETLDPQISLFLDADPDA